MLRRKEEEEISLVVVGRGGGDVVGSIDRVDGSPVNQKLNLFSLPRGSKNKMH